MDRFILTGPSHEMDVLTKSKKWTGSSHETEIFLKSIMWTGSSQKDKLIFTKWKRFVLK